MALPSFRRHVGAVFAAVVLASTVFSLYVLARVAIAGGTASQSVAGAGMIWLGTFVIALPAAGLCFTLAWPVLRRLREAGYAVSGLYGFLVGFGFAWSNAAAVGKVARLDNLQAAAVVGALVGIVYWRSLRLTATAPSPST